MYYKDDQRCCLKLTPVSEDYQKLPVLTFQWNKPIPYFAHGWSKHKDSIIQWIDSSRILEIVGYQCSGENVGIGLERAKKMREVFNNVPDDRIRLLSVDVDCNEKHEKYPFEAVEFNLRVSTEKIVEKDGYVLVYFPSNSSQKINDKDIEIYLQGLVEKLKSTNKRITITGHTDDVGEAKENLALGQRRADAIKEYLVKLGLKPENIKAVSAGETIPIKENDTPEGRAINRRTEIAY
jgi:outer membrane protein OmpA-like peptidoglycan-associated protein